MILESMKKIIKKNCKKQGRNITTGVVVAFFLGTMGTYASEISTAEKVSPIIENNQEEKNIIIKQEMEYDGKINYDGKEVQVDTIEISVKTPVYIIKDKNNGFLEAKKEEAGERVEVKVGEITNKDVLVGKIDEINVQKEIKPFNLSEIIDGAETQEEVYKKLFEYLKLEHCYDEKTKTLKISLNSPNAADINVNYNLGNGIGIYGKDETEGLAVSGNTYNLKNSIIEIGKIKNENLISGIVENINNIFNIIITSEGSNGPGPANSQNIETSNSNIGNGIGIFSGTSHGLNLSKGNSIKIEELINDKEISGKIKNLKTELKELNNKELEGVLNSRNYNLGNGIGIFSGTTEGTADGANNVTITNGITNNGDITGNIEKIEVGLDFKNADTEVYINIINQNLGNGIGIKTALPQIDITDDVKIKIENITNMGNIEGKIGDISIVSNTPYSMQNYNLGNGIGLYIEDRDRWSGKTNGKIELSSIVNNGGTISGYIGNFLNTNEKVNYNENLGNGIGILQGSSGGKDSNITIEKIENINGNIKGDVENFISGKMVRNYNIGNGVGIFAKTGNINIGSITNEKGTISGYIKEMDKGIGVGNGISIISDDLIGLDADKKSFLNIGNINNNGIITGKIKKIQNLDSSGVSYAGNGIALFGNLMANEIKNTGVIAGHVNEVYSSTVQYLGNGIINKGVNGAVKNFINTGDIIGNIGYIKGKLEGINTSYKNIKNSGNGISFSSLNQAELNMDNIDNKGNIYGEIGDVNYDNVYMSSVGNGITLDGDLKVNEFNNEGSIKGHININNNDVVGIQRSGNGVDIWANTTKRALNIEALSNKGLISGDFRTIVESHSKEINGFYGNGIAILNHNLDLEDPENTDMTISNKITNFDNDGIIKGKIKKLPVVSPLGVQGIGNGIYMLTGRSSIVVENFDNTGYIAGNADKLDVPEAVEAGSGLLLSSSQSLKAFFNNKGVILGKINENSKVKGSIFYDVGTGAVLHGTSIDDETKMELTNLKNTGRIIGKTKNLYSLGEETGTEGMENKNLNMIEGSGTGIEVRGTNTKIENIKNIGILSGSVQEVKVNSNISTRTSDYGNGVSINNYVSSTLEEQNSIEITNIKNMGILSGFYKDNSKDFHTGKIVAGNGLAITANYYKERPDNPIKITAKIDSFENVGTIMGKENGLYFYASNPEKNNKFVDFINSYNNYGLMIGQTPLKLENFTNTIKVNNNNIADKGYAIVLDKDTNVKEVVGTAGESKDKYSLDIFDNRENKEYSILNTTKQNDTDAYQEFNDKNLTNTIINGVGENSGVVTVKGSSSLENGIINAYKTAITIGDNSEFTGTNVIINGGGLRGSDGETEIIKGTEGKNILTLAGNVELNGSIDLLGAGDNDTFNFGKAGAGAQVNIYDEIKNVENINATNGSNITLYETSKITGTDNLTIEAGSQMILRVDSSEEVEKAGIGTNVYKTHALYNATDKTLFISGDTSKLDMNSEYEASEDKATPEDYKKLSVLNVKTNGLGVNSTIAFGNVHFGTNDKINSQDDKDYTQNNTTVWVKTNSILHGAKISEKLENGKYDTNIKIEAEKDLFSIKNKIEKPLTPLEPSKPINPDKPVDPNRPENSNPDKPSIPNKYENLYVKLNEIYKGIHTSNDRNFNALNDIVTNYTFGDKDKSDYPVVGNEKMQMATLLGYLRSVYAETPYSFSNESTRKSMGLFHDTVRDNNFKAKEDQWLIYGGLVHQSGDQEQTYYGRNYHGFDTGTADTDAEIKLTGAYGQFEYGNTDTLSTGIMVGGTKSDVEVASSKLKGTGAYIGVYAKKDIKDLRLTAGAGYQYTEYDGTRRTINQSYSEDYKDKALNLYLDGKYSYDLGNNLYLVPKAGLSYTHIDQDSIKERKDKALALDVNSKDFDVLEGTVGVDIKKVIPTEKGKHSISAGISYRRILSGDEADYLTANYGGKDFEILVPHKNKGQVSLGARYEVELENGIFYDVKGNYFINTDSKENTNKNADRGEWRVGAGIGYKF